MERKNQGVKNVYELYMKLEVFWLALGRHHRQQHFLVGSKFIFCPWGWLVLSHSLGCLKWKSVVIGIFKCMEQNKRAFPSTVLS